MEAASHIQAGSSITPEHRENTGLRSFKVFNGKPKEFRYPVRNDLFPALRLKLPKAFIPELKVIAEQEDKDEIFGSVEKQIQACCDLLPILERHGIDTSTRCLHDPEPWDVLTWIIEQLQSDIFKDYNLSIDCGEHPGFFIKLLYQYTDIESLHAVPVEPFTQLNGTLYGIVFSLISLITEKCDLLGIGLETDSYSVDMLEEYAIARIEESEDGEDQEAKEIIDAMGEYRNGRPAVFERSLNEHETSVEEIEDVLNRYNPVTSKDKRVISWVRDGLELIKARYSLHDFAIENEELEAFGLDEDRGSPLIFEYLRFVWSDTDIMWHHTYNDINQRHQDFGFPEYMSQILCLFSQDDTTISTQSHSDWPYSLSRFLIEGIDIAHEEILKDGG